MISRSEARGFKARDKSKDCWSGLQQPTPDPKAISALPRADIGVKPEIGVPCFGWLRRLRCLVGYPFDGDVRIVRADLPLDDRGEMRREAAEQRAHVAKWPEIGRRRRFA